MTEIQAVYLGQNISLAIQRDNAASILGILHLYSVIAIFFNSLALLSNFQFLWLTLNKQAADNYTFYQKLLKSEDF